MRKIKKKKERANGEGGRKGEKLCKGKVGHKRPNECKTSGKSMTTALLTTSTQGKP